MSMKYIAFYLPQFHEIPENNEMWGKGFTEWTNVKKARPLFKGHSQPVVPLDKNYYDLTDSSVMKWQVNLARKYGIYGFCFYHYWYNGHIIMNKPIEMFLGDKEIDFPFCICWANHNWTYSWASKENTVIYKQDYSDKTEWRKHYEYFLPYLKDSRYIRVDGKPLLVIYEAAHIPQLNDMLKCWNEWAVQDGLKNGIAYAYQCVDADLLPNFDDSMFELDIEYQPQYVRTLSFTNKRYSIINKLKNFNDYKLKLPIPNWIRRVVQKKKLTQFDYDEVWKKILNMQPVSRKSVPGAFVNLDTTPRRQERGLVALGMTPEKLEKYLIQLIEKTRNEYKRDMIFVFAWNEWAEGAYMEPDECWKYGVLEAFKNSLIKTGELPE